MCLFNQRVLPVETLEASLKKFCTCRCPTPFYTPAFDKVFCRKQPNYWLSHHYHKPQRTTGKEDSKKSTKKNKPKQKKKAEKKEKEIMHTGKRAHWTVTVLQVRLLKMCSLGLGTMAPTPRGLCHISYKVLVGHEFPSIDLIDFKNVKVACSTSLRCQAPPNTKTFIYLAHAASRVSWLILLHNPGV